MQSAEADIPESALLPKHLGQRVFSIDYRLSPEHPLPASTNDVVAAYKWLLEAGEAPNRISIIGFSSGGMSVVLALQQIIHDGLLVPACGVPISPWHFNDDTFNAGMSATSCQLLDILHDHPFLLDFLRFHVFHSFHHFHLPVRVSGMPGI